MVLDGAERRFRLEGVQTRPAVSALRGFSAPVMLKTDAPAEDRYLQLAADPRPVQPLGGRPDAGPGPDPGARARRDADEAGEARFAEAAGARSPTLPPTTPSRPWCSTCRRVRPGARHGARAPTPPPSAPRARPLRRPARARAGPRARGAARRPRRRGLLARRRQRRPARAAQRRARPACVDAAALGARPGSLPLRRQHDRRHRRPVGPDGARRRRLRGGAEPTSTHAGRTSPWSSTSGSPSRRATPPKARSAGCWA